MDIDKKLVKKIATLSRIKIQEKEVEKFSKELSKIITWVEKLIKLRVMMLVIFQAKMPSHLVLFFRRPDLKRINIDFLIFLKIYLEMMSVL